MDFLKKDEVDREFTKIEGQVEDRIILVTIGEEELLVLQITFHTQNTKVQGLHFENNLAENIIGSTLVELESLQQKVEFQIGWVQMFKLLLEKGSIEHASIQAKNVATEERWRTTINKLDMWKWQKATLLNQIPSMKNGNQCPILKPSPLPFVYFENDVCVDVYNILSLLGCPFC